MLCQVFTAVSFGRCLFVGLHLILYLITERLLGCDEATVLVFFRSLSICVVKHHLISHVAFIWILSGSITLWWSSDQRKWKFCLCPENCPVSQRFRLLFQTTLPSILGSKWRPWELAELWTFTHKWEMGPFDSNMATVFSIYHYLYIHIKNVPICIKY